MRLIEKKRSLHRAGTIAQADGPVPKNPSRNLQDFFYASWLQHKESPVLQRLMPFEVIQQKLNTRSDLISTAALAR